MKKETILDTDVERQQKTIGTCYFGFKYIDVSFQEKKVKHEHTVETWKWQIGKRLDFFLFWQQDEEKKIDTTVTI